MIDFNGEQSRSDALAASLGMNNGSVSRIADWSRSNTANWIAGAAILLMYLGLGFYLVTVQDRPEAYDIAGYLLEANRIAEHGGVGAFPGMILEGKWEQGNQHPLYILAITPFAEFDFQFMVSAQFVSLFFGALAVVFGYVIALRYYTPLVATLGVAGFALNQLWIMWSTLVACESLLILLSILAMTAIFKGFEDRRYWIAAGFLAGLAYLTKVTALLLLPGFFLAVLLHLKMNVFRTREVYLFVVAFLVGCSPLLISNTVVHGVPIYNVNIDNLTDRLGGVVYQESSIERGSMIRVYDTSGKAPDEAGASVAIGLGDAAGLVSGVLQRLPGEVMLFLETLSPWPLHTTPNPFRWLLGIGVLALFVTGVSREPNTGARNYVLLSVAVFVLALSLHRPIARYLLPIHFYIWLYAAMGVSFLLYRLKDRLPVRVPDIAAVLRLGTASFCALLGLYVFATKDVITRAPDSVSVEPHRIELAEWMRANVEADDRYVEGPNYRWAYENGKHIYPPYEARTSADGFVSFIREYDIKYVIAEMKSMNFWRYRGRFDRRLQFEGILDFDPDIGIQEIDVPEDWVVAEIDDDGIVQYIVYEVTEDAS